MVEGWSKKTTAKREVLPDTDNKNTLRVEVELIK
jgi:hypothetical protein